MTDASDVVWLVGRAKEVGAVQEHLGAIDATVQETWPAGVNSGIVALVRSAKGAADDAAAVLSGDLQRFDDEAEALRVAEALAASS